MSRSAVRELLDGENTLTLACHDPDGPWAADVYFVRTGRDLCYFSSGESRHATACEADPRAAGTVHAQADGVSDIEGVQIAGRIEAVTGTVDQTRITAAYLAKFPFAAAVFAREGSKRKVRLYRLVPERMLYVSNAEQFADRTEIDW